jgi:hypothetical protein
MNAPIILFAYKRPWHTLSTLRSLQGNIGADKSVLYVFCDGPKVGISEVGMADLLETRRIVHSEKWCGEVHVFESDVNKGLSKSVIDGVGRIVADYGRVIVLEDDLELSRYFLSYMNVGLATYEFNQDVVSIHGYRYPIDVSQLNADTFFLRGADCWGWATWQRGWALFEPDAHAIYGELKQKNAFLDFDFEGKARYKKMLEQQMAGEIDSWAIRWYASAFLKNKLTLYPKFPMVRNIGNDDSGTHSKASNLFDVVLANEPLVVGDIDVVENLVMRGAFSRFFNRGWKRKLLNLLR